MQHLKQIIRSTRKYKTSTLLTLLSLVISFLGIIILTLYVSFEKNFDHYNVNADSVYRLESLQYGSNIPAVVNKLLVENVPEIESSVVITFGHSKVSLPDDNNMVNRSMASLLYAGNSFFDIFTLPLKLGSKENALTASNTVVLTESFSRKLFEDENPIGKTILYGNEPFEVTAIMEDFPKNSSFKTDFIVSFKTLLKDGRRGVNQWSEWSYNIFMKTEPGSNPLEIANKIGQISKFSEILEQMKTRFPDKDFLYLTPLSNIHFIPERNYITTNPIVLNVLILLAIVLLIMGAVNFINFSTAQAPLRVKALTVQQVLGGNRFSSMSQIVGESVLLSILALIISFIIYWLSYSSIESFFEIQGLQFSGRYYFIGGFVLFAVAFGILTGIYPSWYVTSASVHQAIKGNAQFSGKGKTFRNTLVTIQFIFTITLLISASFIEKQLHYWQNFNLGINKEHVVFLRTTPELQKHHQALADELVNDNSISGYTYSQFIPGSVGMGWGRNLNEKYINIKCWPVDDNFIDFFGLEINVGRKFQKSSEADINNFILNEKAVEQIGWDNPLEEKISGFGFSGQVVGVVKNFNFSSLKDNIIPMQLWRTDTRKNILMLRLTPGNITQTFSYIKQTAQKFDSQNKFEVEFLDGALDMLYKKEVRIARFIEFVAIWCMLLAITGLLGLIIFICRDRTKEIGVRKVNGAKITEIITMLNKDFIKWVAIAFVVACPIGYFAMQKWLENFAYKTTLSWWVFALAGVLALGIALLTVSWQSWRAATRNPIEALRYE